MIRQMQITEARARLNELKNEMAPDETISITSRGREVFALMPWELYESMVETIEILSDPDLMQALQRGIADVKAGRVSDWEALKGELGVEL